LYDAREALPSKEADKRAKKDLEKFINGEIPRLQTEFDLAHTGIGNEEYSTYQRYKTRLFNIVEGFLGNDAS
jgi:hypothetical protein